MPTRTTKVVVACLALAVSAEIGLVQRTSAGGYERTFLQEVVYPVLLIEGDEETSLLALRRRVRWAPYLNHRIGTHPGGRTIQLLIQSAEKISFVPTLVETVPEVVDRHRLGLRVVRNGVPMKGEVASSHLEAAVMWEGRWRIETYLLDVTLAEPMSRGDEVVVQLITHERISDVECGPDAELIGRRIVDSQACRPKARVDEVGSFRVRNRSRARPLRASRLRAEWSGGCWTDGQGTSVLHVTGAVLGHATAIELWFGETDPSSRAPDDVQPMEYSNAFEAFVRETPGCDFANWNSFDPDSPVVHVRLRAADGRSSPFYRFEFSERPRPGTDWSLTAFGRTERGPVTR